MRVCFKTAMAFGLVAILAGPAMAQGRGGFGGGGVGNLIGNPGVQKELKLDANQIEKATALAADVREQMTEVRSQLEGLQGEEMVTKRSQLSKPITDAATKKIKAMLKDEQFTRLTQIELQQRGAAALTDPQIAKKLSVTDEQAGKVKTMMADMNAEAREIQQSAGDDRQAAMQKVQALRTETNAKVMALMSDDQHKAWKEMTGEPYTVVYRRPGN